MTGSRFNASLRTASGFTLALLDEQGRILDTAAVTCAWAGTPRFDAWFRGQYGDPAYLTRDGGMMVRIWTRRAQKAAGKEAALKPQRARKNTIRKEDAA